MHYEGLYIYIYSASVLTEWLDFKSGLLCFDKS